MCCACCTKVTLLCKCCIVKTRDTDQNSTAISNKSFLLRYVASWIDQRERQTERAHLTILFEKYVPHCVEQMRNSFKTITPIPENSMVQVHNTQACTVNVFLLFMPIQSANQNEIIIFFLI